MANDAVRIDVGRVAVLLGVGGVFAMGHGEPRASSQDAADSSAEVATRSEQTAPRLERGRELYAVHCAACHGDRGAGDGPAAYLLSPAPRDFTQARFRLASTQNGVPTDADLIATLRRGMPGSAMPAWDWMSDEDLASLAAYVRQLAFDGKVATLLERAALDEEELSREEALDIARRDVTPGEPIAIPAHFTTDAATIAEGGRLFAASCALCHGEDGTGRGVKDQFNEDGTPNQPRDLTAGLFKGGATNADFVKRMVAGLPGSPMPTTTFADAAQPVALAAYLQALIKSGSNERGLQTRRTLRARRVAELPQEATDAAWNAAEVVDLPLMPLWWRDVRVEEVSVRLLHDGRELALRLTWRDATRDDEMLGQDTFGDAAALQWSGMPNPPLFTMGAPGAPVNIWQWKAGWELDLQRVRDVVDRYPNTPPDMYGRSDDAHAPLYLTASAAGNRMALRTRMTAGEALTAQGFGTLAPLSGAGGELAARGRWVDGTWDVTFVRPLSARCEGELALQPGTRVFLAGAVWDGAAGDRNGQKSVTVWHVVELEE